MKKTLFTLTTLILSMVSFCSCSNDDDNIVKTDAVVAILKNCNVDYWQQIAKNIQSECEKKDMTPIITFNNENADVDGQLANVATLNQLSQKYNIKGIIVAPVFTDSDHRVEEAVAKFAGKSIPVVVVDTPLDEKASPLKDIYKAYVGTDNKQAGEQLASIIGKDAASTILIAKVESSVPSMERYQGFCNIMQQQIPTWETEDVDTPENLQSQLALHPGVQNLVVFNGSLCNAIVSATTGLNVYTFDVYKEFLLLLQTPAQCSIKGVVAQNTFQMGSRSVQAITEIIQDKNLFVPTIYITADNLNATEVQPFMEYYNLK